MLSTSLLTSLTDCEVTDYALKHGLSFALFRLPGRGKATLFVGRDEEADFTGNGDAFVIAPFSNDRLVCLTPEYSREVDVPPYAMEQALKEDFTLRPMPPGYAESVRGIVGRLGREGGKTVLATAHDGHCPLGAYDAFMRLASAYPDAFVFCWMLSGESRAWLGASPELLVKVGGGRLETMALAGTRPAVADDFLPWDKKNIEEQQMVADYIEAVTRRHGLEPYACPPRTKRAGGIEHICTDISAELTSQFNLTDFLKEMAPTPAVSGLPRPQALREIAQYEHFDREYYAGYCGVKTQGCVRLYVTLRCMSLDLSSGDCRLYAGGGITALSVPESEWREVNAKAATLSSVLNIQLTQQFETTSTTIYKNQSL